MSENISEEENSLFRDYKSENFDDNDLQSRLYAEIYYESNIEGEPKTSDSRIQFANMVAELNSEPEGMQQKEDKQSLEFEASRDKSSKAKKTLKEHCNQNTSLSNEGSVIEPLMSNDMLQSQNSTNDPRSVEIQTDKLSDREINPIIHEYDNNDNPGNLSVEKGKKCNESVAKKHKSFNHTKNKHQENSLNDYTASSNDTIHSKYNVVLKCMKKEVALNKSLKNDEQTSDSSDSEESIFEVPIPPKPKPPLINLQDSDEEKNDTNSRMNNLISEKIPTMKYKITDTRVSSSHQDTSFKNKNTDKSLHNKNTTVNTENTHTHTQEIREDIVLNCTIVQKSAKSINEIKQSSKSAELNKNQEKVSTEDTNQNSTKQLSQNTSKENNANFQQRIFVTPGKYSLKTQQNIEENNTHNRYNLRSKNNTLDAKASCSNSDVAINRKRQHNETEDSKDKRQCINQEYNQDIVQQSSSKERGNEAKNECFKSMPNAMRNYYYNSSRDLENFDVSKLQQGMSKDPRMWMIIDEDLMPSPPSRQRTRFWNVRCSNCHRDGHQRYDCPVPRKIPCCYICGEKGHVESRCPQKICLTCGHESMECPDLWRRYHQTTDMSSVPQNPDNVMKPPGLLHCCNCTKRGHESSMCKEYRWSQHFQTPAAVTNYIDGPMYMDGPYTMNFSDDFEIDTLSRTTSSRSIPNSPKNIQQITEEHPAVNIDTLSSNAKASETPASQGTLQINLCSSGVEKNLESPSISNILRPEEKQKKHKQNVINEEEFTTILFSFGKFHYKNNKNARIISRNLSLLKSNMSSYGKKTIINSLPKRQVVPDFLRTLSDKGIEFELKTGFTVHQTINLQLIAMNEYVELIYDLLLYWLNLPDEEKSYGVDVTLPMSPTKMFNLLSSRLPQLTKMSFTCYAEHIQGVNDPRGLFNLIKRYKKQLQYWNNGTRKQYLRLRTRMWRVQVKLLMIVNTEPQPNVYISQFHNAMKKLESKKQNLKMEKLDNATYLKLTLLYNHLFVPHTPATLCKTLSRIEKHAEKMTKNTNCARVQELEKDKIYEQENIESYLNVNSSASATPYVSQDINSAENSTINIQQNTTDETLIEKRGVIDVSSIIDEIIDSDDNEIMIIEDSVGENCGTIMSLNTEISNNDKSVLIQTEDKNENQVLTNDLNIECNTSAGKQDVNTKHITRKEKSKQILEKCKQNPKNITRKEKSKQIKLSKQQKIERKKKREENIYQDASFLIKEAHALNLPHIMNAANELERKISNRTLQLKHVCSIKSMIRLEKKYRKKVDLYWKNLNT
ncbi:uncharacterized protein LOC112639165 isoform X2 [Camponotus floridanus]|uniref:uncharacterized protein LOC112639165 isoform X2 n=1 Tax=Camponotus floridanus TaxID=104421 RepID=UPI000DC687FE|nr:uncharacterized protein LOC112639165 isoform X2 [Camponotus floridanus]